MMRMKHVNCMCGLANFDEVEIEERAVGVHTDVKHLP